MYISKKMFVFFMVLLCTAMFHPAIASKNETVEQKIRSLEQKIEQLEQGQEDNKDNIATAYKKASNVRDVINDYKLGTGAYFRSSYSYLDKDESNSNERSNIFTNYLELNFNAKPTKDLQFHATLSMYKLFGGSNSINDLGIADYNFNSKPSNANIGVKRAYVDYKPSFLNNMVNLEFGRLPTSGGYLTKYRYNRSSQASYPDLVFNGEADGVALTFYTHDYLPYAKSLSFIYTVNTKDTDSDPYTRDTHDVDNPEFYVAQADFSVPVLKDASFKINYTRYANIDVPNKSQIKKSVANNLAEKTMANNSTFENLGKTNTANYVSDSLEMSYPDNLGDLDKLVLQLDDEQFLGMPVDIFASFGWSKTHPSGTISYSYPDLNIDNKDMESGPYLNSDDNQSSHSGYAYYLGGVYELPFKSSINPLLGVEYNHGSKHWIGLNIGSYDPYKKLNVRGDAYETYLIQPLVKDFLQVRGGFEYIDRDYTTYSGGSLYYKSRSTDEDAKRIYFSLDMKL